jgi:hypothetical protein
MSDGGLAAPGARVLLDSTAAPSERPRDGVMRRLGSATRSARCARGPGATAAWQRGDMCERAQWPVSREAIGERRVVRD